MDEKQTPVSWSLSQELMAKGLELALEDPPMALRFANLAIRVSLHLGEPIDLHAAQEELHWKRWRRDGPPKTVPGIPERLPGKLG